MRYKALETFTGKLPSIADRNWNETLGESTEESILCGVRQGFLGEIDQRIDLTENVGKSRKIDIALSNGFGFGGHNATVIFRKL
jgi:pantothenate kinase type III